LFIFKAFLDILHQEEAQPKSATVAKTNEN